MFIASGATGESRTKRQPQSGGMWLMEQYPIAGKIIFSSIKILTFSKVSKPAIF
jgi:hypothetical protein